MKKLAALFLSGLMVLGLTACGNSGSNGIAAGSTTEAAADITTEAASDASADITPDAATEENGNTENSDDGIMDTASADNSSKILVVYYSASGHTRRVANDIAAALNADTFELVPQTPYTDEDLDWTKNESRVNKEHEDETLRDIPLVSDTVDNWDTYSTVLIGYPIWWGIAAWPVDEFVKNNDFTGKTVIPFATSSSSGMGESAALLEEMAGTGNWQDGQRFSSGVSDDEVTQWAENIQN